MAKTGDEKAKPLKEYWLNGEGSVKIAWGTPGDFDRCVTEVTSEAPTLKDVKGYCAQLHHDKLGVWPGGEGGGDKKSASAEPMTVPPLSLVPGVDILATGEWPLSTGLSTFTADDLRAAVEAAACPAVGSPVLKLGHVDPNFDGQPAVGRVSNMRLSASGNKITGDLTGMPGWLATPDENGQTILGSAYPNRSIEGFYDFACTIGHKHPFVITALALLGVAAPGVGVLGTLDDVARLFGVAAGASGAGTSWKLEELVTDTPPVMAAGITTEDVRRAYYATPGIGYSNWICEMQLDPPQLIVCDEGTNTVYRVPMTFGKDGDITFGDQVEVTVEYVDAPAKKAASALVFASAEESRAGIERPAEPPAPAAPAEPEPAKAQAVQEPSSTHAPMTGKHSHPHSAYGAQGGDSTHGHMHEHAGDANHAHAHAKAGKQGKGATGVDFTDEQLLALRSTLGLAEDAELTPAMLVSATAELNTRAAAPRAAGGRLNIPAGTRLVDQSEWDSIQEKIAAGEKFRTRTMHAERDTVIASAVAAGKFAAARTAHWARLWDADPDGTREVIASLTKNVVPVNDIGTPGGAQQDDDEDREFAGLFAPGAY